MMHKISGSLAIAFMLAVQGVRAAEDVQPHPLQGTWVVVSSEKNGKANDDVVGETLIFDGDKLTTQRGSPQKSDEATFTVDPKATPAAIDIKPAKRKDAVLGIYKLTGDRLQICFCPGQGGRPTEFTTKPDTQTMLMILERRKQK